MKAYENLAFTDDFMFCRIMESEPELCEELTSIVLGRQIHIAGNAQKQKVIEIIANGRGVRMDIYFEDDEKALYNLEMQNSNEGDLPRRSRYYQSLMDLAMAERGMEYDQLGESFVVFLCRFDPFCKGLYRYTFRSTCVEEPELALGDGAYRVFLNARSAAESAPVEMKALLSYLSDGRPASKLTERIQECVEHARAREEWKMIYFEQNSREATIRREGEKIGEERGRKIGEESKAIDIARRMKSRGVDDAEIAEIVGLSVEEIEKL